MQGVAAVIRVFRQIHVVNGEEDVASFNYIGKQKESITLFIYLQICQYKNITKTLQGHYKDITKTLQIDITVRKKAIWQEIPHRD